MGGCVFQGVEPIDIVLVKRDGRLTGEAFVVLAGPMHVDVALSKNRSYMGRRYIEIYAARKMVRSTREGCLGWRLCFVPSLGHQPGLGTASVTNYRAHAIRRANTTKYARSLACVPANMLQDYYRAVVSEVTEGGGGGHGGGGGGGYRSAPRGGGGDDRWGGGGDGAPGTGGDFSRGHGPPVGDVGTTILKLRGLPFSVSDDDICQWFNDDTSLGISPVVKDK